MKKVIVMVVAVAVIAVLLIAGLLGVFGTPGSNSVTGTMDVVIEEMDGNGNPTGKAMMASMSISPLTPGEQMMLGFGMGVRAQTMETLAFTQGISGLSSNGHYKVWPRAAVKTTLGPDIASIKSSSVEFGGQPGHVGAPGLVNGDLTQYWLETQGGSGPNYKLITVSNCLVRNQTVQLNADNYAGLRFTHWSWDSPAVSGSYIRGAEIDQMYLRCAVGITCNAVDGSIVQGGTLALLKLTVTSWAEAQIQVEIVGMSGGTQGLQIAGLQAMLPCIGLVAIPAIRREN